MIIELLNLFHKINQDIQKEVLKRFYKEINKKKVT